MVFTSDCVKFGGDEAKIWRKINIYFKKMKKNHKDVMNASKKKGVTSLSHIK